MVNLQDLNKTCFLTFTGVIKGNKKSFNNTELGTAQPPLVFHFCQLSERNINEFDQDMVCVSLHYIGIRSLANFKQFNISSLVLSLLEQRKTSLAWALIGRNSSRTFIEQLWKVKLGLRAGFNKIVVVWYTVNLESVCLMERRISH